MLLEKCHFNYLLILNKGKQYTIKQGRTNDRERIKTNSLRVCSFFCDMIYILKILNQIITINHASRSFSFEFKTKACSMSDVRGKFDLLKCIFFNY